MRIMSTRSNETKHIGSNQIYDDKDGQASRCLGEQTNSDRGKIGLAVFTIELCCHHVLITIVLKSLLGLTIPQRFLPCHKILVILVGVMLCSFNWYATFVA